MKKILWIFIVLLFTAIFHTCNCQTFSADVPVERQVLKTTHFNDLTDREKWVLLEKIEDAYLTFNKKEIDPSVLLVFMEENNPICEWTGKHIEGEDGKFIRYYTVDRKHILKIFDL